tara:strand:+ start:172 stop:318 length:147 start_codon:yes stop_codon:yes gene_type:complete
LTELFTSLALYIDPGTGTAIIGAILSVIVGFGMYLKIYWQKIKSKLSK